MDIDKIQKEVKQLSNEQSEIYLTEVKEQINKTSKEEKKYSILMLFLFACYFLSKYSIINEFPLGPLKINQVSVAIKFIPFIFSYSLYKLIMNMSEEFRCHIIHALLIGKKIDVSNSKELISVIKPAFMLLMLENSKDPEKSETEEKDDVKKSIFSKILISFPAILYVLLMIGTGIYCFYFVIEGTLNWYFNYSTNWLFYLIAVASVLHLILSFSIIKRFFRSFIKFILIQKLTE